MGIPQNYDSYAFQYAYTRTEVPWILKPLIKEVSKLKHGSNVLEIGCGTGNYINRLAVTLDEYNFKGFDASAKMLEIAKSRTVKVELMQADAEKKFPYVNKLFYLAFAVDVIHHIIDLHTFFSETSRILKDGGQFILFTDDEETMNMRSLTKYFPEILSIELKRLPKIKELNMHAFTNNFVLEQTAIVEGNINLTDSMISGFDQKCSSAMRLMKDKDHKKGMINLKQAAREGEHWKSVYKMFKFGKFLQ